MLDAKRDNNMTYLKCKKAYLEALSKCLFDKAEQETCDLRKDIYRLQAEVKKYEAIGVGDVLITFGCDVQKDGVVLGI
jgi:hypothetical protein